MRVPSGQGAVSWASAVGRARVEAQECGSLRGFLLAFPPVAEPLQESGLVEDRGGPGSRLAQEFGGLGSLEIAQVRPLPHGQRRTARRPDEGRGVTERPDVQNRFPPSHEGHRSQGPGREVVAVGRRDRHEGRTGLLHDVSDE